MAYQKEQVGSADI